MSEHEECQWCHRKITPITPFHWVDELNLMSCDEHQGAHRPAWVEDPDD